MYVFLATTVSKIAIVGLEIPAFGFLPQNWVKNLNIYTLIK